MVLAAHRRVQYRSPARYQSPNRLLIGVAHEERLEYCLPSVERKGEVT